MARAKYSKKAIYHPYKAEHQNQKSIAVYDVLVKAKPSGKRISASGKVYYEYRKNRSDAKGKRV